MSRGNLGRVYETIESLWLDTYGVTCSEVLEIAEQIDTIFHECGYVISHSVIRKFVLGCLAKEVAKENDKGK